MANPNPMTVRRGGPPDEGVLLGLFDEAVAWLVARGQPGQWGSEPWSTQPRHVERVRGLALADELWIAEHSGEAVGALALGDAPPYVEPADEPELYVLLLITSRRHAGQAFGAALIDLARERARDRGDGLLRVDCWAGSPALIGWYERQGFARTATFDSGGWKGQVLEQRVDR